MTGFTVILIIQKEKGLNHLKISLVWLHILCLVFMYKHNTEQISLLFSVISVQCHKRQKDAYLERKPLLSSLTVRI